MKRTYIAAVLLACTTPAMAVGYYYPPAPTTSTLTPAQYYYVEQDVIVAVQHGLLARGYTVPIDGVYDYHTAHALIAFQRLQGFQGSGIIDQPTLTALGIEGMPATVRSVPF